MGLWDVLCKIDEATWSVDSTTFCPADLEERTWHRFDWVDVKTRGIIQRLPTDRPSESLTVETSDAQLRGTFQAEAGKALRSKGAVAAMKEELWAEYQTILAWLPY